MSQDATADASVASDALALALQHIEAGHHPDALKALLDAWRASRSVQIANTIDTLSKEVSAREPPIVAIGKMPERQAWEEAVEARRPAAYVRLLEAVPYNSNAPSRIVTIASLDADPRLTSSAREWLTTKPPITNENRVPFFTRLLEILDRNEDTRIVSTLANLTSRDQRKPTTRRVGLLNWKRIVAVASRLATVETNEKARDEAGHGLRENDLAILHRIDSILGTTRPAGAPLGFGLGGGAATTTDPKVLFARVYANPDDDEARAVLSDLLQQANDPRGEFIALQLARTNPNTHKSPRERQLEAQWGRTWLGPLAPFLLKKDGAIFERGFPARCWLTYQGQLFAHEEWSTVTHLDATSRSASGSTRDLASLLTSPVMGALRHVMGLPSEELQRCFEAALAASAPWKWKSLGIRGWPRTDLVPLLDGPKGAFPDVQRLVSDINSADVTSDDVLRIIDKWPSVSDLRIALRNEDVASVVSSPSPRRLDHLVIRGRGYDVELLPKTKPKKLHLIIESFWGDIAAALSQMLTGALMSSNGGSKANAIDHVHVTTGQTRAKVVDNVLVRGRWEKLDIRELQEIVKRSGARLTVLKEKP